MDYMIGLDMGTTSVKTVLFDDKGKSLAIPTICIRFIKTNLIWPKKIQKKFSLL